MKLVANYDTVRSHSTNGKAIEDWGTLLNSPHTKDANLPDYGLKARDYARHTQTPDEYPSMGHKRLTTLVLRCYNIKRHGYLVVNVGI
ncbi:hypothetical protein ACFL6S_07560 [Candidatus Poribacteria bacterium]